MTKFTSSPISVGGVDFDRLAFPTPEVTESVSYGLFRIHWNIIGDNYFAAFGIGLGGGGSGGVLPRVTSWQFTHEAPDFTYDIFKLENFSVPASAFLTAVEAADSGLLLGLLLSGDDDITGSAFGDNLYGLAGDDRIQGGEGDDRMDGQEGRDYLRGDVGDDSIRGGLAFDDINGNKGNDILFGDQGDDIVRGGQGNDMVEGGAGDDWIAGDRGRDTLSGGAGADVFHTWQQAGLDRVTDFNASEGDRVNLLRGTVYNVTQSGADTIIDLGGDNQMVLVGIELHSLPSGWIFGG